MALSLLFFVMSLRADDVTISGTVSFASLDGSAQDHDHGVNGIFTVDDGNLIVAGTINCNDFDKPSSACAMRFNASGDITLAPGSALYAENRIKIGNGADVTLTAGGNVTLSGASGSSGAAIISTSTVGGLGYHAGNVSINAGGFVNVASGAIVSAAAAATNAGAISITANGQATIAGQLLSGPSSVLTTTLLTGPILSGTGTGGNITVRAFSKNSPSLVIDSTAVIASQTSGTGAGTVTLEGCDVVVRGLVAALTGTIPGSRVVIRSGTMITVAGNQINGSGSVNLGRIRADSTGDDASSNRVDLFARNAIVVNGPPTGTALFSVTANTGNKSAAGTINVISTTRGVTAAGNAFAVGGGSKKEVGGNVNISAQTDVTLNGAAIDASGGATGLTRAGGHIAVRSYSGAVHWLSGTADARPVDSAAGVPAAQQGTITLTYCTTLATSGTVFYTNGSPVGAFPTQAQNCAPAAPSLPAGEVLQDCNRPPVANDDAFVVAEGGVLANSVTANDADPDANPFVAVLDAGPAHASSFTLNPNGTFTYVHDGSETTADSFTYHVNDGSLDSGIATVTITITPVNDAPVAYDDNQPLDEGATLNLAAPGVMANDTDSDGPSRSAILLSGPAHATSFTLNADGSFVYVHDGSETVSDSFTYKVNDGTADSNVATVTLSITPVNDVPVANDDAYTVDEGALETDIVVSNDTDPDGPAALTAILVSGPAHAASFTLAADGSFSYTHDGSETTSDSFTYKVNDGAADSNVATVTFTVTPVNDPPVANDDATTVDEGALTTGNVVTNDTDVDGPAALTAILVSGPAHAASFTLGADGSFSYTHDGSETTADSFTYKVNDGAADSNVATVTLTITPVDDPPVASDDAYTVAEGGTTADNVLANDADPDSALTAILVSGPAHAASFTLGADGSFSYTHDGSETASDSFTYKASDGTYESGVATVSITVTPENDAPVLGGGSPSSNYTVGTEVVVHSAITVADADSNIAGATVTFAVNYVQGEDQLLFADTPSITGSFNAATGVLTLTGNDTPANYETALRSIRYSNTSSDPTNGPRAVRFVVDDGAAQNHESNYVDAYVNVVNVAPVLGGCCPSVTYTEGNAPVVVHSTITVADADSPQLVQATATITLNYVAGEDVLSFANTATITGSFNAAAGVLTLTGADSVANYQAALRSIVYVNTSSDPSTQTRTIRFVVDDGEVQDHESNYVDAYVDVVAVASNSAPLVSDESFEFLGNTELRAAMPAGTGAYLTATQRLLDNDSDPDGHAIAITAIAGCGDAVAPFDCTMASGAVVHVEANGAFSFTPGRGDSSDSFQYTVTDQPPSGAPLSVVGTASFSLAGEMIWYVKQGAAGNGTSIAPFGNFDQLDDLNVPGELDDGRSPDLDDAGDYIFVYRSPSPLAMTQTLVLEANQHLLGEGAGLSIPLALNGNPSPAVLMAPGTRPAVTLAVGDTFIINNAIPVEVRGLDISGGNAVGLDTSGPLTGSPSLTIAGNTIGNTNFEGIDIAMNGGTSGTLALAITGNTWNLAATHVGTAIDVTRLAGTLNLDISNNTNVVSNGTAINVDGAITITGFSGNTVHGNTAGNGIVVTGATFDAIPGGVFDPVTGGNTAVGSPGNPSGSGDANGAFWITNVQGALALNDLDIYSAGFGVVFFGMGTFTGSSGASLAVTPASSGGTSTIVTNAGAAFHVVSASVDLRMAGLTTTSSTFFSISGVEFTNVAGQFSAPAGSSIVKPGGGGTGFRLDNSGAGTTVFTSNYAGTITNNSPNARSVNITFADAGSSVTFGGAIVDNGQGISLANNTGATFAFNGGLTLATNANAALVATGGGTLTVTDPAGAANNTITTSTGTGLTIANTTIGAANVTFERISVGSSGTPANGIILSNTGTSGRLIVTGNGAAASGGTIAFTTSNAVSFTSTRAPSLSYVTISHSGGAGVSATATTSGLTLANCLFDSGTTSALAMVDVSGTVDVQGTMFSGTGTQFINAGGSSAGAPLIINIGTDATCTFTQPALLSAIPGGGASAGDGIVVTQTGAKDYTLNVSNSTFTNVKGSAIAASTAATSSAGNVNVNVANNVLQVTVPNTVGGANNRDNGILITANGSAHVDLSVTGNSFSGGSTSGIHILGLATSNIQGNVLGNSGSNVFRHGIFVESKQHSAMTLLIDGNHLQNTSADGISIFGNDDIAGGLTSVNATITNNTVSGHSSNAGSNANAGGIAVFAGFDAADVMNVDVRNNAVSGNPAPLTFADYSLDSFSVSIQVKGIGAAAVTEGAMLAPGNGTNNLNNTSTAAAGGKTHLAHSFFNNNAAIPLPVLTP